MFGSHICDKFRDDTDALVVVSRPRSTAVLQKATRPASMLAASPRLSPLIRGAMELVLRCFGVQATVDANGSIYDEEFAEPSSDLAHIAQAFAHVDVVLEAVTLQRSTFGAKALEGLANVASLYGTKSFYDDTRKTFVSDGWFESHIVISALEAAARIMREEQTDSNREART